MNDYPNLKKLMEKYEKGLNSNSKEIRLSMIEVGLILRDITELSVSVTKTNNSNELLKQSVDMLVEIIKQSMDEDDKF